MRGDRARFLLFDAKVPIVCDVHTPSVLLRRVIWGPAADVDEADRTRLWGDGDWSGSLPLALPRSPLIGLQAGRCASSVIWPPDLELH